MSKIIFDLEDFKDFLANLEEVEWNTGYRESYDYERLEHYIDENGYIKVKRTLFWEKNPIEDDDIIIDVDYNYYDDMTIKGEIIDE